MPPDPDEVVVIHGSDSDSAVEEKEVETKHATVEPGAKPKKLRRRIAKARRKLWNSRVKPELIHVFAKIEEPFLDKEFDKACATLPRDAEIPEELLRTIMFDRLLALPDYPRKKTVPATVPDSDLDTSDQDEEANVAPSSDKENKTRRKRKFSDIDDAGVDCQCCFTHFPFPQLRRCFEGHFICVECLTRYADAAISGQGRAVLTCMSEGCGEEFPASQLRSCLSKKRRKLLGEREREESLRLGLQGEDWHQCPHCPYKVVLELPPTVDKVFSCPRCGRETCRVCSEDWDRHAGIPCHEFESDDHSKLRKKAEERMTKARLRVCHGCQTPLIKDKGCNQLTCRCGKRMCYICRAAIKDKRHFCRHPREPGRACVKCSRCGIWTDPKEDDERAIGEIQAEAVREKKHKGVASVRKIGVTIAE